MDEIAKHYLRIRDTIYRFKVFPYNVWVQRQPDGDNLPFSRETNEAARVVCDEAGIWELTALLELISMYEIHMATADEE